MGEPVVEAASTAAGGGSARQGDGRWVHLEPTTGSSRADQALTGEPLPLPDHTRTDPFTSFGHGPASHDDAAAVTADDSFPA